MEETTENGQGQKPKICKMAIASPLVGILGILGLLFSWLVPHGSCLLAIIAYVSPFIGLGLGIVACSKIHKSNGMLRGYVFSISGIGLGILIFIIIIILEHAYSRHRWEKFAKISCSCRLAELGKAMQAYSDNYDKYPTKDRWCDLLVERAYIVDKEIYVCVGASKNDEEGLCYYAINPNCGPNSPGDTVLLFETKGGWNQFGGPELLTVENHQGEGCNILFNDTHVRFIRTERIGELKWGDKSKESGQPVKPD